MTAITEIEQSVNRIDLEAKVKQMYKDVAEHPEKKYHFEMGRALAERLGYDPKTLDQIPSGAIDSFAGVGYFFGLANIQPGQHVVDLGSGSGMDVFYASQQTGSTGSVVGIDMTDAQLQKATQLKAGLDDHINFHHGYIEQLPIIANSMDVVISNGVINLSSDKRKVFEEAARVLKPGGKLAISDIVSEKQLPESIACNSTYWAACIGGAMQVDQYLQLITDAQMDVIQVVNNPYAFISKGAMGATQNYGIKSISVLAIKK
ncbi:MAG: methyltransferase domain-containing protein [Bacteroidota bacterium]